MATLGSTIVKGNLTVTGTINGYTLAEASQKAVDTALSSGMTSTNVPTSKAVVDYVTTAINSWKSSNTKPGTKITMSASGATVTATIGETGYFTSGTKNTYTVPAATLTPTNASASATSAVTLAKGTQGISGTTYSASQPSSGYYVSFTAVPSSTLSVSAGKVVTTAGYIAAGTTNISVNGTTTPVNGTTKTGYITIPAATFSYNTSSSGATFIQCHTPGYITAGSLSPSGTYDKLSYGVSYSPSLSGVVSLTSYNNTSGGALDLTPTVSSFDAGYVGTAADLALKHVYLPILNKSTTGTPTAGNVAATTKVTGMTTATSGAYKIEFNMAKTAGKYSAKTTTSLKDGTGFKGSTYGLVAVGEIGSVGGNVDITSTVDGTSGTSKTIYIKPGSTSLTNTPTGIKTASSGSYYVTSSASVVDGYQGASTPSKTTYIQAGAVSVPTGSAASTSTSLNGTTLTVSRSVSPNVTEGYVKSGSAGTVTITGVVPTESKTASAGGTIHPDSGKLLSSVVVPTGVAKNGYVITGGFITKNSQVYTLSYNSTTKCVDFVFNQ